jgi:histidinol dehydrogenase
MVASQTESWPRLDVVGKSLAQYVAILVVNDLDEACAIGNELAPEHLEIITRDDDAVARAFFMPEQCSSDRTSRKS